MLEYLLKFSTCLAIFMVFYKLFLERENMHYLKRYYLLAALILSLGIPLVTFIQYVEPTITQTFVQSTENFATFTEIEDVSTPTNYTPMILWSIYGLGVIIFGLKFSLNLIQIYNRIRHNPKSKNQRFINVLLNDLVTPHTFFSYIFLNKHKYDALEIPQEVFIHEQAHAKQKHSIDVLFIELLRVVFWFNPLLYFIKKDIKLNHEFLADQAVLKNGVQPSAYQNLLLAFSSNAQNVELANAINYSSIKKRFTVMKKHTSKQKIWLRSILLLPLIAMTLYGFSEKEIVEKQTTQTNQGIISNAKNNPILEISFNPDTFKLNGEDTSLSELKYDFIKATNNEKSDLDIKAIGGINMSLINHIMSELKGNLIKINLDEAAYIIGDDEAFYTPQKATIEEIEEYNKLATQHNDKPEKIGIFKQKDVEQMDYIYKKMSKEQKVDAAPFPHFAPPSPETGFIDINGETLWYVKLIPNTKYYNKKGYLVDKNGIPLNGSTQVNASDVLPMQYITKIYQNDKVVVEFKDNIPHLQKSTITNPLEPLVPESSKQQKATQEEVVEYNKLAKQYNAQPKEKRVVKMKDLKRLEYIYNKMTKEQKASAEPFPDCPPPPPAPDAPKVTKGKVAPPPPPIPADATPTQKKKMQAVIDNYDNDVPPPPAPPAPKSQLDHVIEMAKKGAKFYSEGKPITSDEAIYLLKKNDELNLTIKQVDSKEPKVYITKDPIIIKD